MASPIHENVRILTPDGGCDAELTLPQGPAPFPAVLFLMDAFGLRPWLREMARTLAEQGYVVLQPNLFYRLGPAPVLPVEFPVTSATIESARALVRPLVAAYDWAAGLADIGHFLDFLARDTRVRPGAVAISGYCMGGGLAVRAAGRYATRVALATCFHGGGLATDAPLSPHRFVAQARGKLYFAHADHDPSLPAEQIERLRAELERGGTRFEMETYEGAAHGYAMKDLPAHHERALARHWENLLRLLGEELG